MADNLNLMIGFSSSHGWLSGMIRWFLKSRISHTFISIDAFGARITIGADEGGLNWCEVSRFKKTNQVMLVLKPVGDPSEAFEHLVKNYAGVEYDWISAGIGGIRTRLKWLWKWAGSWFRSKTKQDRMNCAEVTAVLLKQWGFVPFKDIDTEIISAQEIMLACIKNINAFDIIWVDPKLREDYPDFGRM